MMLLQAWPTEQPWVAAKITALILYIGIGIFAIKRGKTPQTRAIAAMMAIGCFIYIVGTAITHHPMSWLMLM